MKIHWRSVNEEGFTTPRDEGLRAVTALDFGLRAQTRTQRFAFNLGGGLVLSEDGTDTVDVEDPFARLGYALENRDTALTFDASYRRSDVDESNFFDDLIILDPAAFVDEGTRTTITARTGLEIGRTAPVGAILSHTYARTSYSDTTDPNLLDTTVNGVDGRVIFRLSDVASTYVRGAWREVDQDGVGANDRTTPVSYTHLRAHETF